MKVIRIHYFQQDPFEGPWSIEDWAGMNGHTLTSTKFFEDVKLPKIADIDWLIILGGPMGVHDEAGYPWLKDEKMFLKDAIEAGKTIVGICLGSQLISHVLGARVYRNSEKEIGWFKIRLTSLGKSELLFSDMDEEMMVFHWHGDTFSLPENAVHIASSEACQNQAYIYNKKVLALQFHLETKKESLFQMIENGRNELTRGKYVQSEKEILDCDKFLESNRKTFFTILDRMSQMEY